MSTGDNTQIAPLDMPEPHEATVLAWTKVAQDLNAPGSKIDKSNADLSALNSGLKLPNFEITGIKADNNCLPNTGHHTDTVQMTQNGKQIEGSYNPDSHQLNYKTDAGVNVTLGEDGKPTEYRSKGFTFAHHDDAWYYHEDNGGKWVPINEPTIQADGTVHTNERGGANEGRPHSLAAGGEKTGAPSMGPDGLPQPGGGYGSYHYGYEFSTSDKWSQADLAKEIEKNYNKYFTLTGDQQSIVPGETINLKLPPELQALGLKAPVKVLAANENGFSFESLPGHFEGAGRTIVFRIVPEESTESGKKKWGLEVSAGGPVAETSLIPGTDLGGKGVWQVFDNNLNKRLPDAPARS